MTINQELAAANLRQAIAKSGKSIAKVAREADTSPAVLDSVLSCRRNLGIDLALRIAKTLDVDLIEFLVDVQLLPAGATNNKSALTHSLMTVFDELPPAKQRQLINIAKAIKDT
jgi:transcriptional regulator with XRE-family HTH domain